MCICNLVHATRAVGQNMHPTTIPVEECFILLFSSLCKQKQKQTQTQKQKQKQKQMQTHPSSEKPFSLTLFTTFRYVLTTHSPLLHAIFLLGISSVSKVIRLLILPH